MDLRTKLVFALVGVSLASMLALSFLSTFPAQELWRASTLSSLDALAESKRDDIDRVVEAWKDRVRLIASRTQLRSLTASLDGAPLGSDRGAIAAILRDAQAAVPRFGIREVTVYDAEGRAVASTLSRAVGSLPKIDPAEAQSVEAAVRILELSRGGIDDVEVRLGSSLRADGRVVGTLMVRMSAAELLAISRDTTGLGQTGETVIAMLDGTSGVVYLSQARHSAPPDGVTLQDTRDPVVQSLMGYEGTLYQDAVDYRGEPVWAATRYLDELRAGLVVKFDASEEMRPMRDLRGTMTRLAMALSGFGILAGILLGLRLAAPIHELAAVAEKIQAGQFHARAEVRTEDEVGLLGQVFNQMTDRLLEANRQLREEIEARRVEAEAPPPDSDPHGGPQA